MPYKKYDPTWSGYMGDYLRGKVGINQLKPQHEFFDAIGLEKALRNNVQYEALISAEQGVEILEDIKPPEPVNSGDRYAMLRDRNRQANPFSTIFKYTDPVSPYAGTIRDIPSVIKLAGEFKSLGISAKEFQAANGKTYIRISGHAGVRRIVTGTRYGANHPTMLNFGIGMQGLKDGIVKGVKFCLVFSFIYRGLEWAFKDEYHFADFLGNVTADMAKMALVAAGSAVAGSLALTAGVFGGSIIGVGLIVLATGFFITLSLEYIDKKYGLSEKLIQYLREESKRTRTPQGDINKILHSFPRY
ncbi:hypothetical protein WEU31_15030 [Morganella morganii]|uniref:hypothetical protein n=1 Tax=Morganella morganii TaxID=582 RepID=UPI0030CE4498